MTASSEGAEGTEADSGDMRERRTEMRNGDGGRGV